MPDKQKILIVDDDANIADLISLYLTKECFDSEIVGDGTEALEKFKTYKPDLILLDIMLPGIDGYDVCREIRKTSTVPIIMLSAKGEVFDRVLGLELGADDYIIKPFDSKELVDGKRRFCTELDRILLGMVDRMGSFLRSVRCPCIQRPLDSSIPLCGYASSRRFRFHLVGDLRRSSLQY